MTAKSNFLVLIKKLSCSRYNVDAAMGLSIAEDIKRACLCPQCLEMRYDVKKENKKIKDVNGYTHPFKNVSCLIKISCFEIS